MQGCGNDYIYSLSPALTGTLSPQGEREDSAWEDIDWSAVARTLSDRHFGVGGDGLVLILPSEVADLRMRIFNADGSEAEMCGNASRCVGRLAVERGLVSQRQFTLETLAGIKKIEVRSSFEGETERVFVQVDMGTELGNPHAVFFVENITDELVLGRGPEIECAPEYPNRTNVEFARVLDRHTVEMRVWERGSGETLACGTGACATAREAIRQGLCDSPVTVRLRGGELTIAVTPDEQMTMTGPAEFVFEGEIEL